MKKIAVLAGDGIGPEIMAQALKVLTALKLPLEFEEALVGGVAYAAFGHPLPAEVVELAKKSDAVLFGAVGDFKYDSLPRTGYSRLKKSLRTFRESSPGHLLSGTDCSFLSEA